MTIQSTAIYLTDNGRALCGDHLGSTARHTGRDLSGQRILRVTPTMVREYAKMDAGDLACESCQQVDRQHAS